MAFTKRTEIELIQRLPPGWIDSVRETYDAYLAEVLDAMKPESEGGEAFQPDTWEEYLYDYLKAELQNALID